jgi:hypothetical protein
MEGALITDIDIPNPTRAVLDAGDSALVEAGVGGLRSDTQYLMRCTELSKLLIPVSFVKQNMLSNLLDVGRVHPHESSMGNKAVRNCPCYIQGQLPVWISFIQRARYHHWSSSGFQCW